MTPDALLTVAVVIAALAALAFDLLEADVVTFGALAVLCAFGVLSPKEALAGFSNSALLTVALLFVLAYALQTSGLLEALANAVMGDGRSVPLSIARLVAPVAAISAFINNTPIVAMFLPTVRDWALRKKLSPSKFLIPLTYAASFGGVCTLIGTSTNLVVDGLLRRQTGFSLGLFEQAWVGVPCAVAGFLYLTLVGHRLLPENRDLAENLGAIGKEYLTEMRLLTGSPLIGKTVESAGLRNLQSLFLVEIRRNDEMLVPVRPTEILRADDHLVFTGKADAIVQFQKSRGLAPCEEKSHFDQLVEGGKGRIIEAVVSHSSPMLGKSVKEGNFRARYDAAVLAVHRHGEKLETKIGETVLRAGDTILLLGGDDFVKQWNFSRDFYMISKLFDAPVINRKRSVVSLATLCAIIGLAAFGVTDVLTAAVCGTAVLLLTRTITAVEARKAIEVNVLVVIAASLGLGQALEKTGAAAYLASQIVGAVQGAGPVAILAAVYLAAGILTEVITNNAAAALVFPIAMAAAAQAGLNPRPFAIALVIAASASFSTPIGYQTNLMVCGPGGYRFRDFLRVGLPLNCLFFAVSIVVIPLVWSF